MNAQRNVDTFGDDVICAGMQSDITETSGKIGTKTLKLSIPTAQY